MCYQGVTSDTWSRPNKCCKMVGGCISCSTLRHEKPQGWYDDSGFRRNVWNIYKTLHAKSSTKSELIAVNENLILPGGSGIWSERLHRSRRMVMVLVVGWHHLLISNISLLLIALKKAMWQSNIVQLATCWQMSSLSHYKVAFLSLSTSLYWTSMILLLTIKLAKSQGVCWEYLTWDSMWGPIG